MWWGQPTLSFVFHEKQQYRLERLEQVRDLEYTAKAGGEINTLTKENLCCADIQNDKEKKKNA